MGGSSAPDAAPSPSTAPGGSAPATATIPPDFVFPVPSPLNEGNADIYAQRALYERTGSLCFTHYEVDSAGDVDYQAMAGHLQGQEGLLEDGRSYVGPLSDALRALDLDPTGIELDTVAYGIGVVPSSRARPQLPVGVTWAPRLAKFRLPSGASGWTLDGPWIAVVGDCEGRAQPPRPRAV